MKEEKIILSRVQELSLESARPSEHVCKEEFSRGHYKIIALIPVWNGEEWLQTLLTGLNMCVDGVIALDDGSVDRSLDILSNSAIVIEIIKKPAKLLSEWNDAQNRYELYRAAAKYSPEWVLCIDADEIIDPRFAIFKRDLMSAGSDVNAFAFHVDDVDGTLITRERYGHRMYRYKDNYSFDNKRLHCRLIPLEITLDEIRLVNVRISHDASEKARRRRFLKYLTTDSKLTYQSSYDHLLNTSCEKQLFSLGNELILSAVRDDGLQRNIFERKMTAYDKILSNSIEIENARAAVYSARHYFRNLQECFNSVRLDAFLVDSAETDSNKLFARYSFDCLADVQVTETEAWLIEEMRSHRDFSLLISKYMIIESIISIEQCIFSFEQHLKSLIAKGVLKK